MRDLRGPVTGLLSIAVALALLGRMAGLVSPLGLDLIGTASLGWAMFRLLEGLGRSAAWSALAAFVAIGGLLTLRMTTAGLVLMPYLLIVPANLFVVWMFARGLLPGREPILLRLIRLMEIDPVDDPRFRSFVRGQCALWAGLALANAVIGLLAVPFSAAHPWIGEALVWMCLGQVLWFAISHHYAATRYGRRETWWNTARTVARPGVLARLTAP